jgi:hypothetical protein
MTAKFDAFKVALEALCREHGVKLVSCGYDDSGSLWVSDAGPDDEDLSGLDLYDDTAGTPEEREQAKREREAERAKWAAENAERNRLHQEYIKSPEYLASLARITEEAKRTREQQMRISTDPKDPAYIDDRPRRVWCNDVEIDGWTVADEFRRVVITPQKVHNGSVRIERLESGEGGSPLQASPALPVHAGFTGVMVHTPDPKPEAPAIEIAAAAEPPTIQNNVIVAAPSVPAMPKKPRR